MAGKGDGLPSEGQDQGFVALTHMSARIAGSVLLHSETRTQVTLNGNARPPGTDACHPPHFLQLLGVALSASHAAFLPLQLFPQQAGCIPHAA
eukprot:366383-Chlamydomonas_euryale.AAC.7